MKFVFVFFFPESVLLVEFAFIVHRVLDDNYERIDKTFGFHRLSVPIFGQIFLASQTNLRIKVKHITDAKSSRYE